MDTSQAEIAAVSRVVGKSGRQHGQFNHVNTYPRTLSKLSGKTKKGQKEEKRAQQWTAEQIAAEADRAEQNSRHVLSPLKPVLVAGIPVSELKDYVDDVMSTAKQADGRRVRSDVHVLLAAVYSLPYRPDDYFEKKEECDRFIADSMKFHEKAYGKVVSAVMHLDESMVHWHVYSVDPDARMLVPGWVAKKAEIKRLEAEGVPKNEAVRSGNIAYKKAMKELQDRFFDEVGERNGLARYGDRRMRYQPGEGGSKRLEREEHAKMLRDREVQQESNRKKIEADRIAQEKINAEAAANLAELIEEKKRIDHQAEFVACEKKRIEQTSINLTATPEFKKDQELKKRNDEIVALKKEVVELKEVIVEKESYIDKLLSVISDLKAQLKETAKKLINKIR